MSKKKSMKERPTMEPSKEAIEAAAQALYEFRYDNRAWDEAKNPDVWRANALVAIESAAPHLLKNMRQMSLYEIEMRDNPERMRAARTRLREEARAVRSEENRLWAEQTRLDKEAAWQEGMLAQFEADLLGKSSPPNPFSADVLHGYRAIDDSADPAT